MAYRDLSMSHLIHTDPSVAKEYIIDNYREARCSRENAAELMKVSKRTLARWIAFLDMEPTLQKIEREAIRAGWHHGRLGGRPKAKRAA